MARTLYSGTRNASSWAFRAWLALKEARVEFEEIVTDIRRPQRWKNLAEIGTFSPPAAVPVLIDDGQVIWDSLAIMEYANDIGAQPLLGSDVLVRARTRSWIAWQHSTFSKVCSGLSFESTFFPEKKQLKINEVESIEWIYSLWEKELINFNGHYLFGDFSLADIALLPSVLRFSAHHKVSEKCPLTAEWIERLLSRPFVQQWLQEAYRLPPIYHEGYLQG